MMEVVEFKAPWPTFRTDNTGEVQEGETLYAIASTYGPYKCYFIWCYSDRAFAYQISDRLTINDGNDFAANWRMEFRDLIVSRRTHI